MDISPTRLALARHNAQIYGVADRIEFILSDYISFANAYLSSPTNAREESTRKIDVVFLSPPWGGPSYISGNPTPNTSSPTKDQTETQPFVEAHPSYSLSSIQPVHGSELFQLSRRITRNIAYFLPKNMVLEEISDLLDSESTATTEVEDGSEEPEWVEVEEEWMGTQLKALTCYFDGLAQGQDNLFG
jgi:trimethylguanosine synthase